MYTFVHMAKETQKEKLIGMAKEHGLLRTRDVLEAGVHHEITTHPASPRSMDGVRKGRSRTPVELYPAASSAVLPVGYERRIRDISY